MARKVSLEAATEQHFKGTRITVTIPPKDYDVVTRMAKARKVSASWIVRDALEKYIQEETASSR